MPKAFAYLISSTLLSLSIISSVFALDDVAGSADHPKLARVAGSTILAHSNSEYAEHDFIISYDKDGETKAERELKTINKEGKLTRLAYVLKESQTPLFALRNYQEAFAEIGDVKELYICKKEDCYKNLGKNFIWSREKRIPSKEKTAGIVAINSMYSSTSDNRGPIYWSAEIQSETASYTVSFYSATMHGLRSESEEAGFVAGQAVVHIDIIESASFKSDLKVVEASEIQSAIADKGHIALYGLLFDTGDDQLTKESEPALIEIAKALKAEQDLNLYVVGHTDSVGSLESNQQLSERRAQSITKSLTTQFDIDSARLIPVGAGLVAPVATNNTEEGRSLNRRVELVERPSK